MRRSRRAVARRRMVKGIRGWVIWWVGWVVRGCERWMRWMRWMWWMWFVGFWRGCVCGDAGLGGGGGEVVGLEHGCVELESRSDETCAVLGSWFIGIKTRGRL